MRSPVRNLAARVATLALLVPGCSRDSGHGDRGAPGREAVPAVARAPDASNVTDASPVAAPPPPTSVTRATPSPTSSVKLLDPGAEPRRSLRYTFRPDRRERMAIELSTAISAESGGVRRDQTLAPLEIALALQPTGVSPEGQARFTWRVESATTGSVDAATDPEIADGWSAQLVPVRGLSGSATVSSRGISEGVDMTAPAGLDGGPEAQMVVQVVQMLRDAAAPLPDEPVGLGARWQKTSTLDAATGHATQTDTYTLRELKGDTAVLTDVFAQAASPVAPGGASGGPPRMDQLLTSGTARVRLDLSRIVAQTALEGTTSMAVSAPGQRMNMVMRLEVKVQGALP